MRSTENVILHKVNPYKSPETTRNALIYQPDDYHISLIASLTPSALRLFFLLAARVDSETGKSLITTKEIRNYLGGLPTNISRARTELANARLIARAGLSAYWINPKVFRPITVTL